MHSTIQFPVKPYIKKFLKHKYGPQFIFTNSSVLAPILTSILDKYSEAKINTFKTDEHYEVLLTEYYIKKHGVFYNEKDLYMFNLRIDHLFREETFAYMKMNKDYHNIKYRTSLRNILDVIGITEDDIKFESLLRDFTRKYIENDTTNSNKKILSEKSD